ncbi:type-2 ice-structuring protein-like isoform X1 [Labrus mixtus]|uniref:type-2 ice-structuring protein-like isoform X1 n=1 Tax=Labrus mixtus TaxID=508554 RepID=UPI0029C0F41C|nr:type-2 ice-structuring protein-like isoform X1 [Labrus mixtus]XP_060892374.1 type-2 ice-structuring protein-like isoform X1 [Labrus mixtus]
MKLLTVCSLICAVMALTSAEAAPEPEPEKTAAEDLDVVKRTCCCHNGGWTQIGHRYFFYVPHSLTWHQAEANCRSMGGHLASVHSHQEYAQILTLIAQKSHRNTEAWIGGSDQIHEGVWRWNDGTCFNYKNWCWGEPNNAFNQDCLQINYTAHKCWDDRWCHHRIPSVCVRNRRFI